MTRIRVETVSGESDRLKTIDMRREIERVLCGTVLRIGG